MDITKIMLIPKLRFPGFKEKWHSVKMEDFAPLQRGFDLPVSKIKTGPFPVVFSNGVLKTHVKYKAIAPGVITGRSGTIGKVHFIEENYWPHNTSLWVTDFKGNNPKYVYFVYKRLNLKKFSTGSGVPTLNRNNIHSYKIIAPNLTEQEKIADFLTTVDNHIDLQQKKLDLLKKYKKGLMQQIFSQKLRFNDDNGNVFPEWQEKKFDEILEYEQPTKYIVRSAEYNKHNKTPVLTAGKTFILGYTNETDGIFTKLPVIIFDDFTTASQFVNFRFKVKSSAMKILKAKPGVNIKVAYELLKCINFSTGDHKRYWIAEGQGYTTKLPLEKEQIKIAEFLTTLDDKVKLEESKLEQTKQFKKALLQQIFV